LLTLKPVAAEGADGLFSYRISGLSMTALSIPASWFPFHFPFRFSFLPMLISVRQHTE
jgi:hypothetical protein